MIFRNNNKSNILSLLAEDGGQVDMLFSYSTPVAVYINGVSQRTNKKWSYSTAKHINEWIRDYFPADVPVRMCPQESISNFCQQLTVSKGGEKIFGRYENDNK